MTAKTTTATIHFLFGDDPGSLDVMRSGFVRGIPVNSTPFLDQSVSNCEQGGSDEHADKTKDQRAAQDAEEN